MPELLSGTIVGGKYRVVKRLGRGGSASVYLVEDMHLGGRRFALKVPHDHLESDTLGRFRSEAHRLSCLSHPHIVGFRGFFELPSQRLEFFLLEYVDGPTLKAVLYPHGQADDDGNPRRGQEIGVARALRITREVLDGLDHAHRYIDPERGPTPIVHRDVKPENVLLARAGTPDECAKVLDFGIARVIGGTRHTKISSGFVGTGIYAPPEQARGIKGEIDARVDVFACGTMLYEMLTGRLPFDTESEMGAIFQRRDHDAAKGAPVPPFSERAPDRAFPPGVEAIARKAQELDPAKRFQSAREMIAAIEAIEYVELVAARATGGARPESEAGPAPEPALESEPTPEPAEAETQPAPSHPHEIARALASAIARSPSVASSAPEADEPRADEPDAGPVTGALTVAPEAAGAPEAPEAPKGAPVVVGPAARRDRVIPWLVLAAVAALGAWAALGGVGGSGLGAGRGAGSAGTGSSASASGASGAGSAGPSASPPPPPVQFLDLTPGEGSWVREARAEVRGRVDDATLRAIRVEGLLVRLEPGGTFSQPVSLREGANEIALEAGEGERASRRALRVNLDTRAPALTIDGPPEGDVAREGTLLVTGRASDPYLVSIEVEGVPVRFDAEGRFRASVSLPDEGPRVLNVVAQDRAGNVSAAQRRVKVERAPLQGGGWAGEALPAGMRRGGARGVYVWKNPADPSAIVVEMVLVPRGPFPMGTDDGASDAKPRHTRHMAEGFFIGLTETTWTQHLAFCAATGRKAPDRPPWAALDHPVVNVDWGDAEAYCRWIGGRLPTEAQWEKAARGSDGRAYPWGPDWDGARCNHGAGASPYTDSSDGFEHTSPAGRYPGGASPAGALDMAGNVFEWCEDWYEQAYLRYARGDTTPPSSGPGRVYRGGGWASGAGGCRSTLRFHADPAFRFAALGFRPVVAAP